MPDRDTYTIHIDGRWSLEDLYVFPRTYEQVYFALEALLPARDEETNERVLRAFKAFPWQGGYSAVGFYNQLKFATPARRRPTVESISYSSPGWIEIGAIIPLAYGVAHIVNHISKALEQCNRTYNQIYTDAQKRELLRIEVERKRLKLTKEQLKFTIESSDELSQLMDLPSVQVIHDRTENPLISMKILLSLFRRVRTLASYQERGKAEFNDSREGSNKR